MDAFFLTTREILIIVRGVPMDKKALKKLKRVELLEMLLEQSKEVERLNIELKKANTALKDRKITISKCGTIAEAAFQLNGVFEAAEKAASQYLENIEQLSGKQEAIMQEQQAAYNKKMQAMYLETENKCKSLKTKTEQECAKMIAEAESQVQEKWNMLEERWSTFCSAQEGMMDILKFLRKEENLNHEKG